MKRKHHDSTPLAENKYASSEPVGTKMLFPLSSCTSYKEEIELFFIAV